MDMIKTGAPQVSTVTGARLYKLECKVSHCHYQERGKGELWEKGEREREREIRYDRERKRKMGWGGVMHNSHLIK